MEEEQQIYMGSGTYGQSRLSINNKTKQKRVRKYIIGKQRLYQNDLNQYKQIASKIKKLDPEGKYFTGIGLNLQKEIPLQYIQMQYGGEDLQKILKSFNPDNCLEILRRFPQLLEGLKLLLSQNLIHGDIKLENIVFDETNGLRFIDYDFLDTIDSYKTTFNEERVIHPKKKVKRNYVYFAWPPEIQPNKQSLEIFYTDQIVNIELNTHLVAIRDFYQTIDQMPSVDFTKFDIWSLGVVAYQIFHCAKSKLSEDAKQELLDIILQNMLNPNPSERNINKALIDWNKIFTTPQIQQPTTRQISRGSSPGFQQHKQTQNWQSIQYPTYSLPDLLDPGFQYKKALILISDLRNLNQLDKYGNLVKFGFQIDIQVIEKSDNIHYGNVIRNNILIKFPLLFDSTKTVDIHLNICFKIIQTPSPEDDKYDLIILDRNIINLDFLTTIRYGDILNQGGSFFFKNIGDEQGSIDNVERRRRIEEKFSNMRINQFYKKDFPFFGPFTQNQLWREIKKI